MEKCLSYCQDDYFKCNRSCDQDPSCLSECNRKLNVCGLSCPCQDGPCRDGCDQCENLICPHNHVLVLSNDSNEWKVPMVIIDGSYGGYNEVEIDYGDKTQLYLSCSVKYKNHGMNSKSMNINMI